jgi:hypothetical protein
MDGRKLFCALLLLPVAGAALAQVRPAVPTQPAPGEPIASLAFDQYLVNLREMPLRPTLSGDFRFTNLGETPLTITKLDPSCGCLTPLLAGDKRTYQPGERGMFRVDVATANEEPGPHEYTVKVQYTDPAPQEALVRFKLALPERKVSVNPPELAFFQYNGQPGSRDIHITDYRGSTLQVLEARSSSELITASVQPAEVDEQGHHRVPVRLSVPGTVPPGRERATITIRTSDPEFSVIRIPVLVDGPERPASDIQLIGHESGVEQTVPVAQPASAGGQTRPE